MKEKILEISDKLRNEEITEQEAQEQFLFLFDVSDSVFNKEDTMLDNLTEGVYDINSDFGF